jgi:hypothetical protein
MKVARHRRGGRLSRIGVLNDIVSGHRDGAPLSEPAVHRSIVPARSPSSRVPPAVEVVIREPDEQIQRHM